MKLSIVIYPLLYNFTPKRKSRQQHLNRGLRFRLVGPRVNVVEREDLEKAVKVLLEEAAAPQEKVVLLKAEVLQAVKEVDLLVVEEVDQAECCRAKKNRNLKSIKNKNRKRY